MEVVLLIGFANGLRTMTPIAVICWAAWLGVLPQTGWSSWAGTLPAVILFTVCAVGEWVGDILPQTPSRKAIGPFAARIVFGALSAALAWRGLSEPAIGGVLGGAVGAVLGTLIGYRVRMWGARKVGRDWPVGITESAFAVALCIFVVYKLHHVLYFPPEAQLHLLWPHQLRSSSTMRGMPA